MGEMADMVLDHLFDQMDYPWGYDDDEWDPSSNEYYSALEERRRKYEEYLARMTQIIYAPCPYCGSKTRVEDNGRYKTFNCVSCDAYASWDEIKGLPKGTLADETLRSYRKTLHYMFDQMWGNQTMMTRDGAYRWLSQAMELSPEECHIGLFGLAECGKAIELVNQWLKENL